MKIPVKVYERVLPEDISGFRLYFNDYALVQRGNVYELYVV